MTKFSVDHFPAGFFNLSQIVARSLPLDLIEQWTHSDHTVETALKLLDPYRVECAVVCTDTSGLTRLTRLRGLIQILAIINHPKELVHAWGAAIGGTSVGVWSADNTEMLYPLSTPPEMVLSMLRSTMADVGASCNVCIGAAVHSGRFFLLADGLYGAEATRVEKLAEEFARPGEVLVTSEFAGSLPQGHDFKFSLMTDLPEWVGSVCRLDGGPSAVGLTPRDTQYPIPYSAEFHAELKTCFDQRANPADLESLKRRYCQSRAVVLIEREREESDIPEVAVLNDLALSAAMAHLSSELLGDTGGSIAKIAGPLGIFTFTECAPAIDFARRFRGAFLERGIRSRIGVDVGELLVFELGDGLVDVAGMPVNLASKLAQDAGEFGRIYLTEAAVHSCPSRDKLTPFHYCFDEMSIDAWVE